MPTNLSIVNPGFELDVITPGAFTVLQPQGWNLYDPSGIVDQANNAVGIIRPSPGTEYFPGGAPQGDNASLIYLGGNANGQAGLQQTLADTLQPNTHYTLTVQIGNIDSGTSLPGSSSGAGVFFNLKGFPGYRIDLLAGNTVLASDNNSIGATIPEGEFRLATLTFDTGVAPAQLGQNLGIRLVNLDLPGTPEAPNIEVDFDDVVLTASAISTNVITGDANNNNLVGGAGDDSIVGLGGNDTLNGGAGADTLEGGIGNDIYYVDNGGDVVVEAASAGTDLVNSSITYTIPVNVEKLTLAGNTAINGTGNTLANTITGNTVNNTLTGLDGNDTLDGKAGIDTLQGGTGNDTYYIDNLSDVVTEDFNQGTDSVNSSVNYTIPVNVEKLTLTGNIALNATGNSDANTLTGNSLANTLTGLDGNDTLDGKAGIDTLQGGTGNDTYTVDNLSDVVTEDFNQGTDSVNSSVNYTIPVNVEKLTLTGNIALNGIGNSDANTLTGNSLANTLTGLGGNDTISGGTGSDTMIGGSGDDTYTVDNLGDVVTEDFNQGTDSVNSSVNYTISVNVENLTLTGSGAINGTGNSLANTITGNTGANTLSGLEGNDTLNGGNGNDTLLGGNDNDTLIGGAGNDSLTGGSGLDSFRFNSTSEKIDTISDFVVADDTIQVSGSGFGGLVVGTLASNQFVIGSAATLSTHRFFYNSGNGQLWYDSNGNVAGGAVQIATLSTGLGLTNADIIVV